MSDVRHRFSIFQVFKMKRSVGTKCGVRGKSWTKSWGSLVHLKTADYVKPFLKVHSDIPRLFIFEFLIHLHFEKKFIYDNKHWLGLLMTKRDYN